MAKLAIKSQLLQLKQINQVLF